MANPIAQFIEAMRAAGIHPLEPIERLLLSGKLIRFRAEGDRAGRRNGWACLFLNGKPAGAFGHYKQNIHQKWKSGNPTSPISQAERQALLKQIQQQEGQRQRELDAQHAQVANEATRRWQQAILASPDHPYLVKKNLPPFGIRQEGQHLLIPLMDERRQIHNLQRIAPDGQKRFLRGGRTKGLFWAYGLDRPAVMPIVIGEGFATMAAIHHAMNYPVVAAMSASGLVSISPLMRKLHPTRSIIIAADNDCHTEPNLGLEAATKAAQIIGASVVIPRPQPPETPSTEKSQGGYSHG